MKKIFLLICYVSIWTTISLSSTYAILITKATATQNMFSTTNIFISVPPTISPTPSNSPTVPTPTIPITIIPTPIASNPAVPEFPVCPSINASILANYPTGLHAIVGISTNQQGADEVFNTGNNNAVQCYCPPTGSTGIQTNWFAAGNLTQTAIDNLIAKKWVFIPNGADWGLSPQPYLAQNLSSVCPAKLDQSTSSRAK